MQVKNCYIQKCYAQGIFTEKENKFGMDFACLFVQGEIYYKQAPYKQGALCTPLHKQWNRQIHAHTQTLPPVHLLPFQAITKWKKY